MYWGLVIFTIILIYQVLRKIFGGSWAFESVIIAGLMANIGYLFSLKSDINKIDTKLSGHIGWHKGKEAK